VIGLSIDHLLIGSPDLNLGCEFLRQALGVRPVPGGVHPGKGTCNALLGLSNDTYIEVIAPDPLQPADLPMSEFLHRLESPGLMWWAARHDDLGMLAQCLDQVDTTVAEIQDGSRRMRDGRELAWRLLFVDDDELGATLPFFISWCEMEMHPGRNLPIVGVLSSMRITHPKGARLRSLLGDVFSVQTGERPQICVEIRQKDRVVSLCTPEDLAPGFGAVMSTA